MQVSEFKGIIQYHDGIAVTDYCNTIPLGSSIIDRQGEILVDTSGITRPDAAIVLETFVDSLRNIYVACNDGTLHRYRIEYEFDEQVARYYGQLALPGISSIDEDISFCESSSKPSQVYCCVHGKVFYWNTEAIPYDEKDVPEDYRDRFLAFSPVQLPIIDSPDALLDPDSATSPTYQAWFPTVNSDNYDLTKLIPVSRVTWYDNRLVCVSAVRNTVYLSAPLPDRFLFGGENGTPKSIISPNEAGDSYIQDFFPSYYSSTASSARLRDAIAFGGSLYFLNDTSIEVWSATGNYDNPIQHNAQNTLFYGGRSPVIIADTLYLLCRDTIHNDFVAGIRQNGQIQRLSNSEIERQLAPQAYRIRPLSVRDQSMIVCYADGQYRMGFSVTHEGSWWKYSNLNWRQDFIAWTLLNVDGTIYGVTKHGFIAKATDANRNYADGTPIPRHVRGGFMQFAARKILRSVEVICDTGVYLGHIDDRPKLYLRVSFDRGNNFGPLFYRKLGAAGYNDRRMIWRNCGSGNSIMIEFGTADNVRFQIYGLDLNLQ